VLTVDSAALSIGNNHADLRYYAAQQCIDKILGDQSMMTQQWRRNRGGVRPRNAEIAGAKVSSPSQ